MKYLKIYEDHSKEEVFFEISDEEYYSIESEENLLPLPLGDKEYLKSELRKLGLIINMYDRNTWKVQLKNKPTEGWYNSEVALFNLIDDEWYIVVETDANPQIFYKCDGVYGLVELFKKICNECEIYKNI